MVSVHFVRDYETLDFCSIPRIPLLVQGAAWSKLNKNGYSSFIVFGYQVYLKKIP